MSAPVNRLMSSIDKILYPCAMQSRSFLSGSPVPRSIFNDSFRSGFVVYDQINIIDIDLSLTSVATKMKTYPDGNVKVLSRCD